MVAVGYWQQSGETVTGMARAIDGDSLRLGGRELRLAGIDAPELHQSCEHDAGVYPCGREARDYLSILLARAPITCTIREQDRYGRGLALCRQGEMDVNAELVREGQAIAYGRFDAEERQARASRRGVWAGRFERPADWRRTHPR
ncbi:thermonuclease family protein [Chelatococcus sp.]|jgi:endonuclease YncB( thermonuclease family)|uniref:thermonuclease family protein n=1 Tax=Chelatococcus sp. TaxID=1953771 RepID=UPI0025BE91B3|nr:thermonuclease family protein [Chelatococcus sp.]